MSDNIPFEIQMEIIKKVYDVKSLIQFRKVSKPWKSFIDSADFIKGYGARRAQPHSLILTLSPTAREGLRYICLVDDDHIETCKVQQEEPAPFVVSPLLKQCSVYRVVGACHGLLCLVGFGKDRKMVVIWNPSIGKSFGIAVPRCRAPKIEIKMVYGFGVCPVTSDPTVVRVLCVVGMPWQVEVFTLSSGVWNVIPSGNLPRQSIKLNRSIQVTNRFIYWGACEMTSIDDGRSIINHMVVSFDLITKEFKVVDLPANLTNELNGTPVFVSKLRESLVVYGSIMEEGVHCCGVWVMEHDSSFRKLFTIGSPISKILGFRNNDEPIFRIAKELGPFNSLDVYDPSSQQIKNLGIRGLRGSFFMDSYKESLLLLDHPDLHIYS